MAARMSRHVCTHMSDGSSTQVAVLEIAATGAVEGSAPWINGAGSRALLFASAEGSVRDETEHGDDVIQFGNPQMEQLAAMYGCLQTCV